MIKDLEEYEVINHFDPSSNEFVGSDDLTKILEGQVTNKGHSRNSVYFIVCRKGLEMLSGEGTIKVDTLPNVIDRVFNRSEWFGKFCVEGESQIIVPSQYDLSINTQEKKIFLQATERAGYYGSGNLQLDKDFPSRILRTDIGFDELRGIVNSSCSGYKHGYSLLAWNK